MCGRFTLTADADTLQAALELGAVPSLEPRYNIAPTQPVAVVADAERRDVTMMRWGLVPPWADDPSIGSRMINARAETVAEKPSFRKPFKTQRCLILADGFYEWRKENGSAQPYYFRMESGEPFAFAGLWEQWRPKGEANRDPLLSCTLITGPANERVAAIHHRQPMILTGDALWQWMAPQRAPDDLLALLRPLPADELLAYPVATIVNSPMNDGASLIEPLPMN
ncbi:MAG: SOS response-associated peptidase [Anaerolineales bacterium]|nr:SOS response-associated peptidase [Anaerolineales bacterium]